VKKEMETGVSTSAANASRAMALVPLASVGTTLPDHFPWLSAFSSVQARSSVDLGDELALFADEVLEWAEQSLAAGLEACQDDDWPDL
jgi:hypothetical protein